MRRIALSVGDPNGIGPEIVLRTLDALQGERRLQATLFGPPEVLRCAAQAIGLERVLSQVDLRPAGKLAAASG